MVSFTINNLTVLRYTDTSHVVLDFATAMTDPLEITMVPGNTYRILANVESTVQFNSIGIDVEWTGDDVEILSEGGIIIADSGELFVGAVHSTIANKISGENKIYVAKVLERNEVSDTIGTNTIVGIDMKVVSVEDKVYVYLSFVENP